LKKCQEGK